MESKKPEVSVLIVSYKSKVKVGEVINSLYSDLKSFNPEFLVFDNSQDFENFSKHTVSVYGVGENIGYGLGINYLSLKAKGKYFIILNSDIEIIRPLKDALRKYMYLPPQQGVFSLGTYEYLYKPFYIKGRVKKFSSYGFIIHKDLFRIVGGFNPNYFMYLEDDDLAQKILNLDVSFYFPKEPYIQHLKDYTKVPLKTRKQKYY